MYLINKTNIKNKIEISNPNELHSTGRYTNLEFEFLSIKPKSRRDNYFEQITLPSCEEKYWKYNSETIQVVEMTSEEKAVIDATEVFNLKVIQNNWEEPENNIRFTADYTLVEVGGILYNFAANMKFRGFVPKYNKVTRKYTVYINEFAPAEESGLNGLIAANPTWEADGMLTVEYLDAIELIIT